MNEENKANEADIRLTAIALGEFPDPGEMDREEADCVTRVARLVEKAYEAEPRYRLTDAQRDLVLGGADSLRAIPAVNAENRRTLATAAGIGLAAAASIFLLIALWPSGPKAAGMKPAQTAAAAVEEEGVVMRVQFLQKPIATVASNAVDPEIEAEAMPDPGPPEEEATPDSAIAKVEETPAVENEAVSLAGIMEEIADRTGEDAVEFDSASALAMLDDSPVGEERAERWGLADFHSMTTGEDSARTLQRLRFHGPGEEVSGMLVALRFDPNLVLRYRPVEVANWTPSSRELIVEIPESAAKRGQWDLLLEVDSSQVPGTNPERLASAFSPNLGDVVVAGAGDQVVARLKVSSEMEMSPSLRRQLALASFSRWLVVRHAEPADILAEVKALAGDEFKKVEAEILRQLR